ncbi:zinc finger protein matrin type, putative [Pediculus humanus corporis]|uniref:Zinc finger protein matrin type, putative n=1 Tax=Pediculus humanus subsp. corporis TaxID=121224 RepID=E0VDJ3_PEDHC|nr:zinc finger protein matrin type, putative [Pediculus humanus corporis]EEB11449.1 zinc finger protein matrin type, putative [Pediculus humanus corporis]
MASGSVEDHRRKWDRDHYIRLAAERLREELEKEEKGKDKHMPVKRELLKQRDYRVDLESKLGKSVVITKSTPSSQSGGYYCNACDCVVKDSINFLDHINGKKHQRNLGMSMRVERSSLDQVKKRFELNKKKLEEKEKDYDIESRVKELKEEEDKLKEYRKEQKRAKKRLHSEISKEDGESGAQDELSAIMGFSGFGSSKK